MIKIATWNVNSINARLETVIAWLKDERPDIVLLQELKCLEESFPHQQIEELGYNLAINGQKTYNGVAILSKYPLTDIVKNFPNNPVSQEARYIEALVNFKNAAMIVASVYVPNGQDIDSKKYPLKLEFLRNLGEYHKTFIENSEQLIVGGDFNIALSNIDVYDHEKLEGGILFSDQEKKSLRQYIAVGFADTYRVHHIYEKEECYTWWDYRANAFNQNHGMRIDYIFCSPEAMQFNTDCSVSKEWRAKNKPSDHVSVVAVFDL